MSVQTKERILRRKEVQDRTGLPRTTLYELIKDGRFPKPVPLYGRSVGWAESQVQQWIDATLAPALGGAGDE